MAQSSPARWVRALRPAKRQVDPWNPLAWFWETERTLDGAPIAALTVLLAGAECPFSCVFCDLWRQTLDGPTPPGALPAQLRNVLGQAGQLPRPAAVKLYNASNFFEQRAVPAEDEPALLELLAPFSRVTVECHPRLVGERCLGFARGLRGQLEAAMGLETAHPQALAKLNKGMDLDDFDRAADRLRGAGIGLRAFVLVGAPFVPGAEAVEWAVRSAAYALSRGAQRVSLIPVREGNGALEALRRREEFTPPTLDQLEAALERSLELGGMVAADLWDVERLATCPRCAARRIERLSRMNTLGRLEPRPGCERCGWS
jgi:radical SAM enzyme (TIGR01210 family)